MKEKIIKIAKFIFLLLLPVAAFILSDFLIKHHSQPICLWKILFHFDCPGCGITRAFHALCLLKFKEALEYNPLIFVITPIFTYIWLCKLKKALKNIL